MANHGPPGGMGVDYDRGRRIGKYEIVTRLSMGGMAELFLAFTTGPGGFRKFVALKQILPDVQKDDHFVKMFLDEARITAALAHANIAQVFDLGDQDGELYLAMEFLAGQNLEQIHQASQKQQRPLPLGFSARVVRDACLGLHYAHAYTDPSGKPRPVVHRDVSQKNVMVTFDGHVKVIDFGIAKAKGRLGRTQVGMVKGTTGYMSPEQAHGAELDGRSDLFCMGIILHELLCGRRLFTGSHEGEVMLKIAEGEVPSPISLNPRVPQALADVVMRALAREPRGRFATGREMARAIEAACGAELFHEEQLAAVMRELFEDKIQKTRALLESANGPESEGNTGQFGAVPGGAVTEEVTARIPRAPVIAAPESRSRSAKPPSGQVTPTPKPAGRRPTASPIDPVPTAAPTRAPSARSAAPVRPVAVTPEPEEDEDDPLDKTQPVRRPPTIRPPQVQKPEEEAEITGPSTLPLRAALERPEASRQGSGWGGKLFLLLLLAAIGGAIAYPPTRAMLAPLYASALKTVKGEFSPQPPPSEPVPIPRPATPPPTVTAQAPEPTPEPVAPEPEPTPPPELEAPRADAKRPRKQAAAPKAGSESKPAAEPEVEGAPEVIDMRTVKGATKAKIGWLTLYTSPRSAVFDGDNQLGTTPLRKVPLPADTYRLNVVDPDGVNHWLSVPIKPGQVTEMSVRVSDLPVVEN
ncbi:MAG TPA: protein kinase [Archangium sp.]|uniref:serine/threonine protein kinase n=1 Tax=Archangium sp. TaxID=1872627 RepID=UPI002ED9B75D